MELLPVLLYLRQWQEFLASDPPDLPTLIEQHHIPSLPEGQELKLPPAWAKNHLRKGNMLVMFDGFDELKGEQRESLSQWLGVKWGVSAKIFLKLNQRGFFAIRERLTSFHNFLKLFF